MHTWWSAAVVLELDERGKDAYMTISFSYAYLKGLLRLIVSSDWVTTAVHRPNLAMSPLITSKSAQRLIVCTVALTIHEDSLCYVIRIVSRHDMVHP
jgi:hypothetical protein